ncbi:hypothetical protein CKF53_04040 [Corynebacterium striatum]|nr:hypothetical protein D7S42_09250 [Corynebacterium striatum]MBD0856479.1 hypothetical protein [Corynebacterium striatum]PXY04212.1 hypothetical protein CKF55_13990 [Corynebacterium striatum]PXY06458.1 hypothetical protein CKF53_04040 [Corynebacterium striatum]PXY09091.1 hypothetical protein CKF55_03545 [Corynebacterium striatum]
MSPTNNDQSISVHIQATGYDGHEPLRECPNCHSTKPLSEFGYRNMGDGIIRNQSWCKECR